MNRLRTLLVVLLGMLSVSCGARPNRVVFGIGMTANTHVAVTLAAQEINAEGGLDGVPLELMGIEEGARPNDFDPATTLEWANRFAANKDLLGVIGHSDSASTLSAASLYNRVGVPHVVTIATNPSITGIGPWTYRLCLSDAAQGPALAEYAVTYWKKRRIAIFFANDDYGRGLTYRFEQRARELGAEIVTTVMHRNLLQDDDKETIRAALTRLKTGPPVDLVALFQRVNAAQWTVEAIGEAGLEVDKLGGDTLAQYVLAEFRPDLTEGLRVSQFFALDTASPRAVQFAAKLRALSGSDPDYSQAFAYDAVFLLRDAVLQGGYSRAKVRAYLDRLVAESAAIPGVGGRFTLGPDHDARRPMYIAEIFNKGFRVLQAVPAK